MLHPAVKMSRKRIHRNGGINVALEMHKESNKAVDKCGTPLVKVSACQAPQQCSQNALLFFLRLETAFHRFELYTEPEYVQSSRIRSLARLLHLNLRVNTTSWGNTGNIILIYYALDLPQSFSFCAFTTSKRTMKSRPGVLVTQVIHPKTSKLLILAHS